MQNNLMEQFASAYQQDFTQRQEPSKLNKAKTFLSNGYNQLSTRGSISEDVESQPTQQKSSGGLMSMFQREQA